MGSQGVGPGSDFSTTYVVKNSGILHSNRGLAANFIWRKSQVSIAMLATFLFVCHESSVCGTGHTLCFTSNNDNNK